MTQEFKTLEEIKDEYWKEVGFKDTDTAIMDIAIGSSKIASATILENHYNIITQRYAQQYIDANKELVETLRQVVYEYEQGEHSFKTILEIKELLNKQS